MITFDIECDGDGGLILIEENDVFALTEEFANLLDAVVDVEGKVDMNNFYPEQNWQYEWQDYLHKTNEYLKNNAFFIGLLKVGDYQISIRTAERGLGIECTSIEVRSGKLLAIDAGDLIQKIYYPNLVLEVIETVSVGPGKYNIHHLSNDNEIELSLVSSDTPLASRQVVDLSGRT